MPQNSTITLPEGQWTQLTDADVASLTFTMMGPGVVVAVVAAVGAVPPTDFDGAIEYREGQGERNVALADLFPGIAGANRVYAYSTTGQARCVVSHV